MPSISMYTASAPVFTRLLKALDAVLDKAVVFADAKKIEHSVLLTDRIAPDMFNFTRQVQAATDHARRCVGSLAGVEVPSYDNNETSFAELKERIAKTLAFIASLTPAQIDGSEDKHIVLKFGANTREYRGIDLLLTSSLPNFFFHYTTAYDILRHNGVEIGKRDFLG